VPGVRPIRDLPDPKSLEFPTTAIRLPDRAVDAMVEPIPPPPMMIACLLTLARLNTLCNGLHL
jgi:hypothetical protein